MRTHRPRCGAQPLSSAAALLGLGLSVAASAEPDFSGVWGMVQHDRLGAPFFIPIEPKLNAAGSAITAAFVAKYDVENLEANGSCVEPGMPTVMWGIGGAAMEIVQQPERITLLSELANQSRRIYLDGRLPPDGLPDQRVGFSVGRWEGETLVVETTNVTEWQAPRWPHSDCVSRNRTVVLQRRERDHDHRAPAGSPAQGRRAGADQRDDDERSEVVRGYGLQGHRRLPPARGPGDARGRLRQGIWMEALEKTAVQLPAPAR